MFFAIIVWQYRPCRLLQFRLPLEIYVVENLILLTNYSAICQYGKDYEYDAPVKLLDKHMHAMAQSPDEQLVVVSQVFSFLYKLAMKTSIYKGTVNPYMLDLDLIVQLY